MPYGGGLSLKIRHVGIVGTEETDLRQELRKEGLNVPGDVLIAGVNGNHVSAECDPPLTTFVLPCKEIGSAAVELMFSRIDNPSLPPREVMLASRFVIRSSTTPTTKKEG